MGIKATKSELAFYKTAKSTERHQFEYLYWVYIDSREQAIRFDSGEVSEVSWRDIRGALRLLEEDSGWYSCGYDIQMLESLL